MDAPRLPSPPLRRRPARGALAVARAARRVDREGVDLVAVGPPAHATPINLVDVARGLTVRPAIMAGLAALVAAVTVHVGVGGASLSIRPAKRGRATTTSVAVEAVAEPLAEDLPPPPPPPPPREPAPSRSPTTPMMTPTTPSTPTTAAALTTPGLSPSSFGVGVGVGAGGGFAAGVGQALPSSTPQAGATSSPTLTPARAISRPPPRYPPTARRDGVTGVVILHIQVDASGGILDVRIVESDPAGVFDEAAIESARSWRFTPATRDGAPVTSWVRQTIRFTLEAT